MGDTPTSPIFDIPEDAVANTVGIQRRDLAALRGPQGGRWAYGPNRRVLWSREGIEALRGAILSEKAAPHDAVQLPPGTEVLTVTRSRFPNSRVLLAAREKEAGEVTVYLGYNGANRNFAPGMKILCRHRRGAVWDFEADPEHPEKGRRMPRRFGVW
jgi:hypothetical protein